MAISTDVSCTASELMREAVAGAREEFDEGKSDADRALAHGTAREKYDAYCEASNLKEQVEAMRDDLAELMSFAQSHLSEAEELVSKCEERETTLESAWEEADEDQ